MNSELTKKNIKGESELSITLWPEDGIETDFFNALFSGQVEVKQMPNQLGKIVIKRKEVSSDEGKG